MGDGGEWFLPRMAQSPGAMTFVGQRPWWNLGATWELKEIKWEKDNACSDRVYVCVHNLVIYGRSQEEKMGTAMSSTSRMASEAF